MCKNDDKKGVNAFSKELVSSYISDMYRFHKNGNGTQEHRTIDVGLRRLMDIHREKQTTSEKLIVN